MIPSVTTFRAVLVTQTSASIQEIDRAQLPPGEVLVRIAYSSLNYKDGLAVTGTMAFTTLLYYLVATRVWGWHAWVIGPLCLALVGQVADEGGEGGARTRRRTFFRPAPKRDWHGRG